MIYQHPGVFFPMEMKLSNNINSSPVQITNENQTNNITQSSSSSSSVSSTSSTSSIAGISMPIRHINAEPSLIIQQQAIPPPLPPQTTTTSVLSPHEQQDNQPSIISSTTGTSNKHNNQTILKQQQQLLQPSSASCSICDSCCQPICDRYIMKVVDTSYHENCLKCTLCSMRLLHSCFIRDGKLYCRIDYERLFVKNRCLGCGEKISSNELVMRASDNVFHLKCFICVVCGIHLQTGDQYVIKQSQLFCRPDYEKEVEMLQGYSYDDYCCEDIFQSRVDGRRGPKRPRTILTTQQRRAFKASFDVTPKPCRKIREGLAKDTGLSIRIVQVWFQNQRAKVKKIQKKQQKENNKNNTSKDIDSPDTSSDTDSKMSVKIKDENPRSNSYLHDSCSDTDGGMGDTTNDMMNPFKHVKEELENDEEFFKLMSNQHKIVKSFEDGIKNENTMNLSSLMGLDYSSLQQIATSLAPPQILNPIDRLYSMQNSYFCNENNITQHSHHQHQHHLQQHNHQQLNEQ